MRSDFQISTEVVAEGAFNGIEWVAARAPIDGAVNGYVRLPDGHPWLTVEEKWDIDNSIPWGEITYRTGNWVGFDTLHSGQYWPGARYRYPGDELMTESMVIGWTRQLAEEAHAAGTT